MSMAMHGTVLMEGPVAEGAALVLSAPISFWGGVDPHSGDIIDARHPQRGERIGGTVLFLPGTIGSSSASSVYLELIRNGHAPAALVMDAPDAILLLGAVVAHEMGLRAPAALKLSAALQARFAGSRVRVRGQRIETI